MGVCTRVEGPPSRLRLCGALGYSGPNLRADAGLDHLNLLRVAA